MGTGYKNRGSGAAGLGFKNRGAKLVEGAAYTNRGATDGVNEAFKNRGQAWGSDAYYNRGPNDFASLSVLGLAEFYAPLVNSLILTRGTGNPTYSRATNAWEFDNEGKLIFVPSGAARFGGARMVYNQIAAPTQDFTSATWGKSGGGGVTVSGDAITAPDGTLTADKIIPNAGTAQHYIAVSNRGTWPIGSVIVNSIYAKYAGLQYLTIYNGSAPSDGAVWFDLINGTVGASQGGAVGTIEAVGDGWYRCKLIGVASSINTYIEYHSCTTNNNFNGVGDGVNGAYLWGPQLEKVTGQADQTASEYVSVGVLSAPYHGAGVDGVKWFATNKNGSAIPESSLLGYHAEGARTNSLLWSGDLTNAAWAKTNITAAKTATGIDNAANSASTLTAGAADATILQTLTLAAAARSFSAYVKRRTGSGNIYITRDGGTSWTDVTSQINSTTWTRVKIENTSVLNPQVGFKIATSGDAIDVDVCQDEPGAFISGPIITTTAAVTRNTDALTYALAGNAQDSAGSIVATWKIYPEQTAYITARNIIGGNVSTGILYGRNANTTAIYDGTSVVQTPAEADISVQKKSGLTWTGATRKITNSGATPVSGAYDGAMFPATINISDTNNPAHAYIKNVYIWQSALTDAQLQQVTA